MKPRLSSRQYRTVDMLARGSSITDIIKALKLRRGTLSNWLGKPVFIQELDRLFAEQRACQRYRLSRLAEMSISAVQTDLNSIYGDPKRLQAVLNLLKALGAMGGADDGIRVVDKKYILLNQPVTEIHPVEDAKI